MKSNQQTRNKKYQNRVDFRICCNMILSLWIQIRIEKTIHKNINKLKDKFNLANLFTIL